MPYTIETKDGIEIKNIPDDVDPDSDILRQRVEEERSRRDDSGFLQERGEQAKGLLQVGAQMVTDIPRELSASLAKMEVIQSYPGLSAPAEEVRAAAEQARSDYPESLTYEAESDKALEYLNNLGEAAQTAMATVSEIAFDNGDVISEHGWEKGMDMTIDAMDISAEKKNEYRNLVTMGPEVLGVAGAGVGTVGGALVRGAGKGAKALKGAIPTKESRFRTPKTETEAAQILKDGNVQEIIAASDIDPEVSARAQGFGLDPETQLPLSATIRDPYMRAVVEAAERHGTETPGQLAGRSLDETLLARADEYIASTEFGAQGKVLTVADEIPGAATKGRDSYSHNLQESLDTEATTYRNNIDENVRPTSQIKTSDADTYLMNWVKESGAIPELPPELQAYARRVSQSDARKALDAEIERVGGAENLSPQYKAYQKTIEAEEAAPEFGDKGSVSFKALKTRQRVVKDAQRAAEKSGHSEKANNLRQLANAVDDDLATHLEGIPGNEINGLSLADQQRRSNMLYRKGFEVRKTREALQTKELTQHVSVVVERAINKALTTKDLSELDLAIQRIAHPDLEHVDPKGRPQRYKPISEKGVPVASDVLANGVLSVIRGPDWLKKMEAINSNPKLKRKLLGAIPPYAQKQLTSYADFTRGVLGRQEKTLSKGEYSARISYIQDRLDRLLQSGTHTGWGWLGAGIRGASRAFQGMRGRNIESVRGSIDKLLKNPDFQRGMRFGAEDKAVTPRVNNTFDRVEKSKAWKKFQEILPPTVQAGITTMGLGAYLIGSSAEEENAVKAVKSIVMPAAPQPAPMPAPQQQPDTGLSPQGAPPQAQAPQQQGGLDTGNNTQATLAALRGAGARSGRGNLMQGMAMGR